MNKNIVASLFLLLILANCFGQSTKTTSERDPNGEIEQYDVLKSDKSIKHGAYKLYIHEQTIEIGQYVNNRKEGEWQHFKRHEGLISIGDYVNNEKEGLWKYYDGHDRLIESGEYQNGKKDGPWKIYHKKEGDIVRGEGDYQAGDRVGKWKYYNYDSLFIQEFDFDIDTITFTSDSVKSNAGVQSGKYKGVVYIDELPTYGDDHSGLMRFIGQNIKYPPMAQENDIEGTVVLRFHVSAEGDLSDFEITRRIGGGCAEEAVRVLKESKDNWKPGYFNGEAVNMYFVLPVRYRLD